MSDIADIRERLSQDVFDYQALVDCLRDYRRPRDRIGRLVADGDIVRIRQGLYTFSPPFPACLLPLRSLRLCESPFSSS